MRRGVVWRALVVVAAALLLWGGAIASSDVAVAPNPCVVSAAVLRCPDLVMLAPTGLTLDRTTKPGRVLLRAQSAIENVGAGPLDIRGYGRTGSTMSAKQEILGTNGRWYGYLIDAHLDFKYVPGDRYGVGNVGDATYWKFRNAAAFQLWSVDAERHAVALVRTGPKLDYCLRDLERTHPSGHSPRAAVYGACNQSPGVSRDHLGTSAGWSDVYPYGYPEQWIDVTGLHGTFAFAEIADPLDLIHESNEQDNVSEVYVSLPSARVLGRRVGVPGP